MNLLKQLFITLFTLSLLSTSAQTQNELSKTKVTDKISMKVPMTFTPMNPSDLRNKYLSSRAPIAMYTSPDQQIDLGINVTNNTWQSDDLEILKSFYKANIMNLFTEVNIIQETIQEIGERKFIVFEFVSRVTDQENTFGGNTAISKYTYIEYTIYGENVLLFNFTSPARVKSQWAETVKEMMESVRIK